MNNREISKYLYGCLSSLREANGQPAYPPFSEASPDIFNLFYLVIDAIRNNEITSSEDVHNYWITYAKVHDVSHSCIVPYLELSEYEKSKDKLVLEIVKILIKL